MYFVKNGDICIRYIGTEKWDERELPDFTSYYDYDDEEKWSFEKLKRETKRISAGKDFDMDAMVAAEAEISRRKFGDNPDTIDDWDEVLDTLEKDFLNASGVGGCDHFGHFNNPVSLQFPVYIFIIQLLQIVAEPFILHGKQPEERGLSGSLAADQAEHQLKLAARLKYPLRSSKHEYPKTLFVKVGNFSPEEMMKREPDARCSVPDQTVQIITDRVILVFVCDNTDGFCYFLLAGQAVQGLEAQLYVFLICVGQHSSGPFPVNRQNQISLPCQ